MESGEIYSTIIKCADGSETDLSDYRGKVMLIVNVASRCGFTPQYAGLQELYNEFREKGFTVLGFPCNQFAGQEPGSDSEIQSFCSMNFGVTFPVFAKIDVNGENTHPLYKYLKAECPGLLGTEGIKWNFTKFLVDKNGKVLKRFAPSTSPKSLEDEIRPLLN